MTGNNPRLIDEIIGTRCRVVRSTDPSQVGLEGVVLDETKNTLLIGKDLSNGSPRTVQKHGCVFSVQFGSETVELSGDTIAFRPEDRIKKLAKKATGRSGSTDREN